MSFQLKDVVPWGRSYEEYASMFSLNAKDLGKRLLGCGDGPASFNSVHSKQGGTIVSVDPIYQFTVDEIKDRIDDAYDQVMVEVEANPHEFVWKNFPSLEAFGQSRMDAMKVFLKDFSQGKTDGRYVVGQLPSLAFEDRAFDLALCSHFLFIYSHHFSFDFHIQSIAELCRVASEVRIFPLLELGSIRSRHADQVIEHLQENGYECAVEEVDYEFQQGGNEMLRVKKGV